jgi:hypothetical protein
MSRNGLHGIVFGLVLFGMALGSLPASAQPCPGDYNGDGPVSVDDLTLFLDVWFALPRADFDGNGVVDIADIFAYLSAHQAGLPSADTNGDGQVTQQDLFDYLDLWFLVTNSPSTDFDGDGVVVNDIDDIYAFIGVWTQPC